MKCPKCGNELEEGKLLCEHCGEEVKIVPDFDIELEAQIHETLSSMAEDIAEKEQDNIRDDDDDDIKDEWKDYFPKKTSSGKKLNPLVLLVIIVVGVAFLTAVSVHTYHQTQDNSYEYQYKKAVEAAATDNYDAAISYLERALALNPDNTDARYLLAMYYDKNGQQQSAILVLQELLKLNTGREDEVYDLLLSIYEKQEEYVKMGELLKSCNISKIITKYNKYAALEPVFNKEGGEYDELISITLKGNTDGFVYYTLDGSAPTTNSMVYETPILLESGEYTIRAFFVNMYGVESNPVSMSYSINLKQPSEPIINPESGNYTSPQFIEVYHDDNTKIFYTMDGTTPTDKSTRYTEPIEMPFGVSNFAIVAVNDDGLASDVIRRTYQFQISANFSTDMALQVLVNNLWAKGKLLDVAGHVPNRLGTNSYRVQTVADLNDTLYYIVYEEYVDTMGKAHDTNNIYAIDVNTADLYTARKTGEGQYILQPFANS